MSDPRDEVLYEVVDHAAWITINRPERRNALSRSVMQTMIERFSEAADDPEVWVAVVRGAGGRAFSAGADLKDMAAGDQAGRPPTTPMTGSRRNLFECVLEIPKPTLASIDGFALAGGFELAMACDLRIASDDAEFGMPEAKIGMGANFASVVLPRIVPRSVAFELLYLGERISAARALDLALVNRVVPKAELEARTRDLVAALTANAPLTLRRYKEMIHKGWELPVATALRLNVGPNPYTSEDRMEGVRAVLEKRTPRWQGR